MSENEITEQVIGLAINIHDQLGPGLPDSVYEACLYSELLEAGLYVERQKPVPLIYRGVELGCSYRADLVVERKVIVEVEAVEALAEIHQKQIFTYIKLLDLRLGLLINFNVANPIDGIKRVENNLSPFPV